MRALKLPYYIFVHGMLDPWFNKAYPLKYLGKQLFWWFSEGPLLRHARAVFFTSEQERIDARGSFWPYRLTERVVRYGTADAPPASPVLDAAFRATVPALGSRCFLLFLSRIHPKKGCDFLVRAFVRIAADHPDLDLVIAGPDQSGWRATLEGIGRQAGIAQRLHWPGMLQGDAKWGAYHGCEAFVLPSHQENFGIVVAEAMACAKPVLISDKINIWREVREAGAGLVASDDQQGTDSLLQDFLTSGTDVAAMGQAARRTFLEKFEIGTVAADLLAAIRQGMRA